MARLPERVTFDATAGCIALILSAAVALLIYATLTFVDLLPAVPAQVFSSLV